MSSEAIRFATIAVEAEKAKNPEKALINYKKAVGELIKELKNPNCPPKKKEGLKKVIEKYLSRAEELKKDVLEDESNKTCTTVSTKESKNSKTDVLEDQTVSSFVAGAVISAAIKSPQMAKKVIDFNNQHQISTKTLKTAKIGYGKAKELDNEYQITTKTSKAAKTGYEKSKEFDSEHKLTEKTLNAMKAGCGKAKEINNEHKVVEKVVTAGETGFKKVEQINSQYNITGKLASTWAKGMDQIATSCATKTTTTVSLSK